MNAAASSTAQHTSTTPRLPAKLQKTLSTKDEKAIFFNIAHLLRFAHLNILCNSPAARAKQTEMLPVWKGGGGAEVLLHHIALSVGNYSDNTPIAGTEAGCIYDSYYLFRPAIACLLEVAEQDIKPTKPDIWNYIKTAMANVAVMEQFVMKQNRGLVRHAIQGLVNSGRVSHDRKEDLVWAGESGLWKAVYKYNFSASNAFSTSATNWIKAEISDAVEAGPQHSVVDIPRGKKKLFAKVMRAKQEDEGYTVESICDKLVAEQEAEANAKGKVLSEKMRENLRADIRHFCLLNPQENTSFDVQDCSHELEADTGVLTELHERNLTRRTKQLLVVMNNLLENQQAVEVVVCHLGLLGDAPMNDREIAIHLQIPARSVKKIREQALQALNDPVFQAILREQNEAD